MLVTEVVRSVRRPGPASSRTEHSCGRAPPCHAQPHALFLLQNGKEQSPGVGEATVSEVDEGQTQCGVPLGKVLT